MGLGVPDGAGNHGDSGSSHAPRISLEEMALVEPSMTITNDRLAPVIDR